MINPILIPTPNFGSRKGHPILLIVLHSDASPNSMATRGWIQNPKSRVSYHLEVERDGTVVRYVEDLYRSWAVGYAEWQGHTDLNSISLSASFANRNDGKEPLTEIQIATMKEVVKMWRDKYPQIADVTTHREVSRWEDGSILRYNPHTKKMERRKSDPDTAPNFRLSDYAV